MRVLNKKVIGILLMLVLGHFHLWADVDPSCDCDQFNDGTPSGDAAFIDCQDNGCTGYDLPVTDHLWVLLVLGAGVALYSIYKRAGSYEAEQCS